jgi:hypothetical protein
MKLHQMLVSQKLVMFSIVCEVLQDPLHWHRCPSSRPDR